MYVCARPWDLAPPSSFLSCQLSLLGAGLHEAQDGCHSAHALLRGGERRGNCEVLDPDQLTINCKAFAWGVRGTHMHLMRGMHIARPSTLFHSLLSPGPTDFQQPASPIAPAPRASSGMCVGTCIGTYSSQGHRGSMLTDALHGMHGLWPAWPTTQPPAAVASRAFADCNLRDEANVCTVCYNATMPVGN